MLRLALLPVARLTLIYSHAAGAPVAARGEVRRVRDHGTHIIAKIWRLHSQELLQATEQ